MGTFALDLKAKTKKSSKKKRNNVFGEEAQRKKKTKIKLTHVDEYTDESEEKLVIKPEQLKSSFYNDSKAGIHHLKEDTKPCMDNGSKLGLLVMEGEREDATDERRVMFRRDDSSLPEITKEEEYEKVPVEEFGEALLRGMGWNGQDEQHTDDKTQGKSAPRPQYLGIGAKPLPNSGAATKKGSKDVSFMPVVKIDRQSGKRLA